MRETIAEEAQRMYRGDGGNPLICKITGYHDLAFQADDSSHCRRCGKQFATWEARGADIWSPKWYEILVLVAMIVGGLWAGLTGVGISSFQVLMLIVAVGIFILLLVFANDYRKVWRH